MYKTVTHKQSISTVLCIVYQVMLWNATPRILHRLPRLARELCKFLPRKVYSLIYKFSEVVIVLVKLNW